MPSYRHWTTFILFLCFTIACQGYSYGNYGNDTSEFFDARDLEVRAGPKSGVGDRKLRIVAVGDVHGDYDRFLIILKHLEVVDQDGKWTGKVDVFVQLGDLMDRGPDTILLFLYLDKLRKDARSQGGSVYTLLGNHEVKNLMHRWDFVNPEELKTFRETGHEDINVLRDLRRRALCDRGLIGKYLTSDYLGALLLPLYPSKAVNTPYDREKEPRSQFSHSAIAFVHAGLCPSTYKKLGKFPTRINSIAKDLVKRLQDFLSTNTGNQPFAKYLLTPWQTLLCNKDGPLWYRGLAAEPNCDEVEEMLNDIGARRIVVGHTMNQKEIVEKCKGKIILIDTGITRWTQSYDSTTKKTKWVEGEGGMLSALDIRYTFDGQGKQTEMVQAVYPGLKKPLDSVQLPDVPF